MDIEKIARKLEPLMPKQMQHWLRIRDLAEPELKSQIDKHIISLAYKTFGDFRKEILLSLPTESKAKGVFNLGTIIYKQEKYPLGISSKELVQNLSIFGRSGAGKTNIAFHLLEQLVENRIPFIFLDWKRTARHLIPYLQSRMKVFTPGRSVSPLSFNPFIPPPGLEKHVHINQLVDVLAAAYTLGDGARSVLQKAIASCYKDSEAWPSVHDVLVAVEQTDAKGRAHGWKVSAVRALQSLDFSVVSSTKPENQASLINSLSKSFTIIELEGLSLGAKKFLVPMLCLWLYYLRLAQKEREELKLVVFVEEAHHVLYRQEQRANESIMEMLMRQCRELGIGIVVIDQHPHLISSAALGNTYTTISLNLKGPTDVNKAAALCNLEDSEKRFLNTLRVGRGVVKLQDRWTKPILVQFPLMNVKKGFVSDAMLAQYLQQDLMSSDTKGSVFSEFEQVRQVRIDDMVLEQEALAFVQDVIEHEDDGVKARYKRLGWSIDKGNRLKCRLIKHGWLNSEIVRVGNSRKLLLKLTNKAQEALGINMKGQDRASLVHEYWKRYYARHYENQGYNVKLEAPCSGGKVDVLAYKPGKRIGIEVETGKSNVIVNVRRCLRAKLDKIVIVATTDAAAEKVQRELAKANLLIPSKIELVVRDNKPA